MHDHEVVDDELMSAWKATPVGTPFVFHHDIELDIDPADPMYFKARRRTSIRCRLSALSPVT